MRLTRVYVEAAVAPGARLLLGGSAANHIARVLRLRSGDALTVFNGSGGEFAARIEAIQKDTVAVSVEEHRKSERESPLQLTLAQGISRGERMDWVIQKATELGASRIVPVFTKRSVVRLDEKQGERKLQHWRAIAVAACEQCGRNRIPELAAPLDFYELLASTGSSPAGGPPGGLSPNTCDPSAPGSTAARSTASGPGTFGPNTSGPGISGPGTFGPGTFGPGTSGPSISGPGTSGPSISGPGISGPSISGPGISGPGTSGPGISGPGISGPGTSDASTAGRDRSASLAGSRAAIPGRPGAGPVRILLSPSGDACLDDLEGVGAGITVLIGPEGGLEDTEQEAALAAGFTAVRMGPRVLRTETAAIAALTIIQHRFGDL